MLGKVLKYELRGTGRLMLPFFGIAIVASGIARVLLELSQNAWGVMTIILGLLSGLLGTLIPVLITMVTLIYLVSRFFAATVKHEAYLTFTLPVTVHQHIIARLISSTVYLTASSLISVLCTSIFVPGMMTKGKEFINSTILEDIFMKSFSGETVTLLSIPLSSKLSIVALILLFTVIGHVASMLKVNASIALGTQIGRSRGGMAFLMYVLFGIAEGAITIFAIVVPIGRLIGNNIFEIGSYLSDLVVDNGMQTFGNLLGLVWQISLAFMAVSLVYSAIYYIITTVLFKNRLNLD